MFNILINNTKTNYNGLEINSDFRTVLKYELLIQDKDLSEKEKIEMTIDLFFPTWTPETNISVVDLFSYISDFINRNCETSNTKNGVRSFDFNIDSDLVYSAFLQVYNIDLENIEMHWWKFLSLFNGLPDNTKLSWVIQKRLEKIPKADKYNRDYVNNLIKIKDVYSLEIEEKQTIGKQINNIMEMWG